MIVILITWVKVIFRGIDILVGEFKYYGNFFRDFFNFLFIGIGIGKSLLIFKIWSVKLMCDMGIRYYWF